MVDTTRRGLLKALSATTFVAGGVGTVGAQQEEDQSRTIRGQLELVGHSMLGNPEDQYAEEAIRDDGQYAAIAGYYGTGGSYLVDLSDLSNPEQVHQLPSTEHTANLDVEFDNRNGLYYRTQEPADDQGQGGVEIIDYGYEQEGLAEPEVIARIDRPPGVHNVEMHYSEPILYLVNSPIEDLQGAESPVSVSEGITAVDVSDPANPERIGQFEPNGYNHDITMDAERDMLHSAYIIGEFVGYAAHDVSDPRSPELVGTFDYAYRDQYTEVGVPGFELAHYAAADPVDDLVVVGDEKATGIPGGKHVLDVGWDQGSFEDPIHIGFTHSPNAMIQDDDDEVYDWTTHNHQVVHKGDSRLLVDGAYHEGAMVYDISDPTDPVPAHQHTTDEGEDQVTESPMADPSPMAWGADYHEGRDFVVVSDEVTGIYVFDLTADEPPVLSVPESIDENNNGQIDTDEMQQAISYWRETETVPNTGVAGDNQEMTTERVQNLIERWQSESE